MKKQVLIAGGGIAGLAAGIGAARAGWEVRLFERAAVFSEVGAGVQLGPNVVRRLQSWGLQGALQAVALFVLVPRLRAGQTTSSRLVGPVMGLSLLLFAAASAVVFVVRHGAPWA